MLEDSFAVSFGAVSSTSCKSTSGNRRLRNAPVSSIDAGELVSVGEDVAALSTLASHLEIDVRRLIPGSVCNSNERTKVSGLARAPNGGEGGIRTHGTRKGSTVFETARFNRSRTSPVFPS